LHEHGIVRGRRQPIVSLQKETEGGAMSFVTVHFAPGDGTQYRAVLAQLDPEEGEKNHVGSRGIFYAFGVGNRSVAGYFFDRSKPDIGYFFEKMRGCDDGRPISISMAWQTLLVLGNHALPERLPEYSDDDPAPHRWYAALAPGWTDQVRRLAGLSELE
jgi:hypothetical protein